MTTFIIGTQVFFLIFARVVGFFIASPFWNNALLWFRFRNTVAVLVSYILLPTILHQLSWTEPISFNLFWFLFLKNIIFGLMMGFFLSMLFSIFQIVGELWSIQIGFSMSQIFDPTTGSQTPVLGEVVNFLALLLFVALQGHLKIIILLAHSFDSLSVLGSIGHWDILLKNFIQAMLFLFKSTLVLGLTLMGCIFITTLFVGLVAKAAPQLNVMLFGMPIYMILGFIILAFLMPNFVYFVGNYIQNMSERLGTFIVSIK